MSLGVSLHTNFLKANLDSVTWNWIVEIEGEGSPNKLKDLDQHLEV